MKLKRDNKKIKIKLSLLILRWLQVLNSWLHQLAAFLQQKMQALTIGSQKAAVFVFCVLFSLASGSLVINSFQKKNKTQINISPIKTIPLIKEQRPLPIVSEKEFLDLKSLKDRLDDIAQSTDGKKIRDSLLRYRPYLMDSLNYLLEIYYQQLKTAK